MTLTELQIIHKDILKNCIERGDLKVYPSEGNYRSEHYAAFEKMGIATKSKDGVKVFYEIDETKGLCYYSDLVEERINDPNWLLQAPDAALYAFYSASPVAPAILLSYVTRQSIDEMSQDTWNRMHMAIFYGDSELHSIGKKFVTYYNLIEDWSDVEGGVHWSSSRLDFSHRSDETGDFAGGYLSPLANHALAVIMKNLSVQAMKKGYKIPIGKTFAIESALITFAMMIDAPKHEEKTGE